MSRPRTVNKHLPKYVSINHGSYWYKAPDRKAIRIAEVGDEVTLYKFMAKTAETAGPTVTLADCLDRYQREIVPTMRAATQKDYARLIRHLKATFGHMIPQDLQPRDVGRYLAVEKGKVHRNKLVSLLSTVYNKAIGKWFIEGVTVNPCVNVERNETKKRDRYITDEEYRIVWTEMPPRVRIAMDLALLTGQRQGDILGLPWEHVSETGIYFQQGKTGKKLEVQISPALQEVLDRAKFLTPQLPRVYVVKSRKGKPYASSGFRAVWQRHMRKLIKSGAIKTRMTFHDIRAKTVSDSKSLNEAMERAGHTNMAMTRGTYDRATRKVTPLK